MTAETKARTRSTRLLADTLPDQLAALLDVLRAAGLQAATDLADLTPPGLLIIPPTITFRFGGCHRGEWTAYAVAGDTGRSTSLPALAELIDAAALALGYPFTMAAPAEVTGMPAYQLSWQSTL